jgi:hypothetical protein
VLQESDPAVQRRKKGRKRGRNYEVKKERKKK